MFLKRKMLPLNALRAFEAAARQNSTILAAKELSVTHGAISQQIKKLEDQLNTSLFDRSNKPFRLTEQGKHLLGSVTEALDILAHKTGEISSAEVKGELTLSCVPGLGANWLTSKLNDFLDTYNGISIKMITDIWHHSDTTNLADISIVYGNAEHPHMRVTRLGHPEFFPVCSPHYIKDKLAATDMHRLQDYTLLHDHSKSTWSRWFALAAVPEKGAKRDIVYDGAHLTLQAARTANGIALADMATVRHDLRCGTLIRLSQTSIPAIHPYYIVTPTIDRIKPAAAALESWLLKRYNESLEL